MPSKFCCARCQNNVVSTLRYSITVPLHTGAERVRIIDDVCLYCYFILSSYYKDCIYF